MFVEANEGDDPRFAELVEGVVEATSIRTPGEKIRVIRIDNWFSQRWRGFVGKLMGAAGVSRGRLVVPPFVPSRVESESLWLNVDGNYYREQDFESIHKRMRSEDNFKRYFDLVCPKTNAIWFSSNSMKNGRGSIMVYSSAGTNRGLGWYVELSEAKSWGLTVTNGITHPEFEKLLRYIKPCAEQAVPPKSDHAGG